MIVASLLLIPVAVLFLALGLINGSSSLLIASIVVSLLAAVALVIGARQAAAARRVPAPDVPERAAPMPESPTRGDRPEPRDAEGVASAEDSAPAATGSAGDSVSYDDEAVLADQAGAAPAGEMPATAADDVDEARAAGSRDATAYLRGRPEAVPSADAESADSDSALQSVPQPAATEDYERASATIDSARDPEPEDQSWRRAAEAPAAAADPAVDEFGEPDDDDPDDEPLPQSVRPADAVLIARLDLEVLVVDGRPRYHMADCPHLVGRLTEPLPANEAVELGFSPCGLCRPVDRLVAAVAHR